MKREIVTNRTTQENELLRAKYDITGLFYDILDYPWERQYRHWRPKLLEHVRGNVLEAGVGTGRNLQYYHPSVNLTGIDLSEQMLKRAKKRGQHATCTLDLHLDNVTTMGTVPSNAFDWMISTFLCCVMPDNLQPSAIEQFERVLKIGGRFLPLEIQYSKDLKIRKRQEFFAPFVEKMYGARFDRHTLEHLQKSHKLKVTGTYFLKDDTYMIIEGSRVR